MAQEATESRQDERSADRPYHRVPDVPRRHHGAGVVRLTESLSAALAVCHANIYQHLPTQFQVFAGSPRQTDLLIGNGSSLAMPSAGNANRVCSLDAGST